MATDTKPGLLARGIDTLHSTSGHLQTAQSLHRTVGQLTGPREDEKLLDGIVLLGLGYLLAKRGWQIVLRWINREI